MENDDREEFVRKFREQIEHFRQPVTKAIARIMAAEVSEDAQILSFEIQYDWHRFPVVAMALAGDAAEEVDFEPPFSRPLLPNSGALIPKGAIDRDHFENAGVATFETGAEVLAEWFGECWLADGGAEFPLPTYIHLHDRTRWYDLRKRQWVQESEVVIRSPEE